MEKSNAEIEDDILKLLLKFEGSWTTKMLYSKLNEPKKTYSHFLELIKEMIADGGKYFNFFVEGSTTYLEKNEFTQEFLDEGGFNKASKIAAANAAATVLELQDEKLAKKVTRDKDREHLTLLRWQKIIFWPVFIFGLIGGLYSSVKIYQHIFLPPDNTTVQQLDPDPGIDSIEIRLQQLEKGLKQLDKSKVIDSTQTKE
tara:strand:+ start:232 stop:831 length:600 start_codon:yes stop_codon:yes gene_type:complete